MVTDFERNLTSRRKFLIGGMRMAALFGVANTAIYSVGTAFEKLDGSIVAGAKCTGGGKMYGTAAACDAQCGTFCAARGCGGACENMWAPAAYCECL